MHGLKKELTFRHAAVAEKNPRRAVGQLNRRIGLEGADAAVVFVSAEYNLNDVAEALRETVTAPLLCCTTAGEISAELGYSSGGMAGAAIGGCRSELLTMTGVSRGKVSAEHVIPRAHEFSGELESDQSAIGVLAIDGLCQREESVIERLQSAMPTVPLVGGSAGDSSRFKQTMVFLEGHFRPDAAALLLLSGDFTARAFQTHQFSSSGLRMAATEVDAGSRRLIGLDGISARTRLAQALGCAVEEVSSERLVTRPLMLKFGEALFGRSVREVHADGSLTMYCAVHTGEVLHLGTAGDIVDTTGTYFEALRHQQAEPNLVLAFDCVLRRQELARTAKTAEMAGVLRQLPLVGFSTFGEQFHGQHVNQTMTGVALWKK